MTTRRPVLRDASELITPELDAAITALGLKDEDAGMEKLARIYAQAIDEAGTHCSGCDDPQCRRASRSWAVRWIGPLLHAALESLGGSPAARNQLKKPPDKPDATVSKLAQLRQASPQARRPS